MRSIRLYLLEHILEHTLENTLENRISKEGAIVVISWRNLEGALHPVAGTP
jgi:hypothetical protein